MLAGSAFILSSIGCIKTNRFLGEHKTAGGRKPLSSPHSQAAAAQLVMLTTVRRQNTSNIFGHNLRDTFGYGVEKV
jgi:hypothetical protein